MKQQWRCFLDVSTGHITRGDNELLERCADSSETDLHVKLCELGALYVETKDQGFYVKLLGDKDDLTANIVDIRGKLVDLGFSASFISVFNLLVDARCRKTTNLLFGQTAAEFYYAGIEFDAGAMIYDELPVHEWDVE